MEKMNNMTEKLKADEESYVKKVVKEARETVLDRKLEHMKRKNESLQRRHFEVEADRLAAEQSGQAVSARHYDDNVQQATANADDVNFDNQRRRGAVPSRGTWRSGRSKYPGRSRGSTYSNMSSRLNSRYDRDDFEDRPRLSESDAAEKQAVYNEPDHHQQSSSAHSEPDQPGSAARQANNSKEGVEGNGSHGSRHRVLPPMTVREPDHAGARQIENKIGTLIVRVDFSQHSAARTLSAGTHGQRVAEGGRALSGSPDGESREQNSQITSTVDSHQDDAGTSDVTNVEDGKQQDFTFRGSQSRGRGGRSGRRGRVTAWRRGGGQRDGWQFGSGESGRPYRTMPLHSASSGGTDRNSVSEGDEAFTHRNENHADGDGISAANPSEENSHAANNLTASNDYERERYVRSRGMPRGGRGYDGPFDGRRRVRTSRFRGGGRYSGYRGSNYRGPFGDHEETTSVPKQEDGSLSENKENSHLIQRKDEEVEEVTASKDESLSASQPSRPDASAGSRQDRFPKNHGGRAFSRRGGFERGRGRSRGDGRYQRGRGFSRNVDEMHGAGKSFGHDFGNTQKVNSENITAAESGKDELKAPVIGQTNASEEDWDAECITMEHADSAQPVLVADDKSHEANVDNDGFNGTHTGSHNPDESNVITVLQQTPQGTAPQATVDGIESNKHLTLDSGETISNVASAVETDLKENDSNATLSADPSIASLETSNDASSQDTTSTTCCVETNLDGASKNSSSQIDLKHNDLMGEVQVEGSLTKTSEILAEPKVTTDTGIAATEAGYMDTAPIQGDQKDKDSSPVMSSTQDEQDKNSAADVSDTAVPVSSESLSDDVSSVDRNLQNAGSITAPDVQMTKESSGSGSGGGDLGAEVNN